MNSETIYRIEQRKNNFMKAPQDHIGQRLNFAVHLRKNKRQQAVIKYREKNINSELQAGKEEITIKGRLEFSFGAIEKLLNFIDQNNCKMVLNQILIICQSNQDLKILDFPNLVLRFTDFLDSIYEDEISEIAMTILMVLTSKISYNPMLYIDSLDLNKLVLCLNENKPKTSVKVFKTFADLASDCSEMREKIISLGIHKKLINYSYQTNNIKCLRITSEFIKSLAIDQKTLPHEVFELCLATTKKFLMIKKTKITINSLTALSLFCRENLRKIQAVINLGILDDILKLCLHKNKQIQEASIYIIGNISYGDPPQINELIEHNIFNYLIKTIDSHSNSVRKETVYIISNIIASGNKYLQYLLEHEIIDKLICKLEVDDYHFIKELSFVFYNSSHLANYRNFRVFVDKKVFYFIKGPLCSVNPVSIVNCLKFIIAVLKVYGENDSMEAIESMEYTQCIDVVESLCNNPNTTVQMIAEDILEFFKKDMAYEFSWNY
ncbi:hypothetical protein SteCoe_11621 [Stentor coeruleus]|uniref:Importin subunit alpha n=1 Tax=Stentor coeruleus TaxID=5963 RepID=A0A1R2CCN5_9CILI|nr:hypothetical protein SteCoe_11621 [Stentor coeruleus]